MKRLLAILLCFTTVLSFSQEEDKAQLLALKKANNFVYEGNNLLDEDAVSAEMEYRKALSEQPNSVAGSYNLGTSYIKNGNLDEAIYRLEAAAKSAISKAEKHKAYHNIGNVLMQAKKCQEAVDAYKNALRNNPSDDETRYNLAVAKDCAEQQKDQNQDENKENQDNQDNKDQQENDQNKENQDNQDNKDQEGDNQDDKKDEGEEDNKEGEDKEDEGQPKDDKQDKGEGGDEQKEQPKPQPQPGQLSPQQIKNLLEAMNNQEQKVQEKMNAEKQKGVIIQSDKDW